MNIGGSRQKALIAVRNRAQQLASSYVMHMPDRKKVRISRADMQILKEAKRDELRNCGFQIEQDPLGAGGLSEEAPTLHFFVTVHVDKRFELVV